ncbi:helix-turn-helix domain-containing protein, partial [Kitasatospora sp. NPDC001574]
MGASLGPRFSLLPRIVARPAPACPASRPRFTRSSKNEAFPGGTVRARQQPGTGPPAARVTCSEPWTPPPPRPSHTLAEVMAHSGLTRSTTHRILQSGVHTRTFV